jgi:hypothetical protein
MHRVVIKIAKCVFATAFIALGVGMFLHPVASASFYPGGKYSGPHTSHLSEGKVQVLGVVVALLGLGLMYSAFYDSRE